MDAELLKTSEIDVMTDILPVEELDVPETQVVDDVQQAILADCLINPTDYLDAARVAASGE